MAFVHRRHNQAIKFPNTPGAWVIQSSYLKWRDYTKIQFFYGFQKYLRNLPIQPDFSDFEFTGFGESSSYAIFAALEFSERYQPKKKPIVVTFGQPKIGNEVFTAFAHSKLEIFRVTLADDLLPLIPMIGSRNEKYTHFKPEFWIEGESNCACSTNAYPIVYKCFCPHSFKEHPECNNRDRNLKLVHAATIMENNDDFRHGPYFGKNFTNCENASSDNVRYVIYQSPILRIKE
ncbi:hypothetical protein G9A89_007186 [Geosiphon pyriformis]|nr:hypothetical protein G9A89_007186 [Geosiphon pyriformis]